MHMQEAHLEASVNTQYACQLANSFKCDYCGSRYKRKEQLEAHITSTHEANYEKFESDICLKTFTSLKNKKKAFLHNS